MTVEPERIVVYTSHAKQRMEEMNLDAVEVTDALKNPDVDQPDAKEDGVRVAVKERLRVVYAQHPNRDVIKTVTWSTTTRQQGPATLVPNHPSNRKFVRQLELWGCTPGRRRGDFQQIRTPSGELFDVRPADIHTGNSASTILRAYRLLDVNAEQFWSRTEQVRPKTERPQPAPPPALSKTPETLSNNGDQPTSTPSKPTTEEPRLNTKMGRLLAYYRAHPGEAIKADDAVAGKLGLTLRAARSSCWFLAQLGHLQKTELGVFKYLRWGESDAEKRQAKEDLAWITDPANFLSPPKPRSATKTGPASRVLDHYKGCPGEEIRIRDVASALDVAYKTVSNAVRRLAEQGQLRHGERPGTYVYPNSETMPDSAPVLAERLDEPQRTLTAIERATAEPPEAVFLTIEDEIDALLDLAVPAGLRARHLLLGAEWCDLTRRLLEATREQGNRR